MSRRSLLLNLFSFCLMALAFAFLFENQTLWLSRVHLFGHALHHVSFIACALAVAFLLSLAVLLFMLGRVKEVQQQEQSIHRKLERQDVSREAAEEKVKVLELKIKTLETALEKALKK